MNPKHKPVIDQRAQCACGAVSVRVSGRIKSMLVCACRDCQKASGTGHATVAIVARDDLAVSGEVRTFSRPANSGARFTRHFCPVCGTPLYGQSSRAAGLAMLPVGLFGTETEWFAPSQVIFARSHNDWDLIDAALPRYMTYREEEQR